MDGLSTNLLPGAIGGLAPAIVRLDSIATNGKTFTWSLSYIVISIVFAGLAGSCRVSELT
jgi:hypothetical protein